MSKEVPYMVDKPWGSEEIWALTDQYVGKVLFIKKGERLSLQHHEQKEETIRVLDGEMVLEIGRTGMRTPIAGWCERSVVLRSGDSWHIPPKTIHRMCAATDVRVLEVSTTELDDVVRHSDDYGRHRDGGE